MNFISHFLRNCMIVACFQFLKFCYEKHPPHKNFNETNQDFLNQNHDISLFFNLSVISFRSMPEGNYLFKEQIYPGSIAKVQVCINSENQRFIAKIF